MNTASEWIEIGMDEYKAAFQELDNDGEARVFGTITDMAGQYNDGKKYLMTEWGRPGAEFPVLKSIENNLIWTYFKRNPAFEATAK